jgi:2-dehydro-3-deoxyphosphogalactonate aldolase
MRELRRSSQRRIICRRMLEPPTPSPRSVLQPFLDRLPLVAILRGVSPDDVVAVGRALVDAGFVIIEVPLNSPHPIDSVRRLADALGTDVLVGAGTVLEPPRVREIADAGGRLVVMPHCDVSVVRAAKDAGLACTPGVATPTEGFAALAAGADALKIFPAELVTPPVLKAMRAVLPKSTRCIPVGGITPDTMAPYVAAGAAGFGLGSALYRPGDDADTVATNARRFVDAWRRIGMARVTA